MTKQEHIEEMKDKETRIEFKVIDNNTGKEADIGKIALKEDWAKDLMYCDMQGFAILDDGNLILLDECGKFEYCPSERFSIKFENSVVLSRKEYDTLHTNLCEYCRENKELCSVISIANERTYRKKFTDEWRKEYQKELDKQGNGHIAGHPDFDLVYKLYFEQKDRIAELEKENALIKNSVAMRDYKTLEEISNNKVKQFAERLKNKLFEFFQDNEGLDGKISVGPLYVDVIGVEAKDGTIISLGLIDELLKEYEKL